MQAQSKGYANLGVVASLGKHFKMCPSFLCSVLFKRVLIDIQFLFIAMFPILLVSWYFYVKGFYL